MISKATFFSMVGMPVMPVTVGTMVSMWTVETMEAVLSLRARSVTVSASTFIVTSPSEVGFGVMVRVYSVSPSVPDGGEAVAGPVIVMSLASNPLTGSEKVMVISKASFFSMVGMPVISTVGTMVST